MLLVKGGRPSERMTPEEGVKQYLALTNEGADVPLAQKPRDAANAARQADLHRPEDHTDSGHDRVVESRRARSRSRSRSATART